MQLHDSRIKSCVAYTILIARGAPSISSSASVAAAAERRLRQLLKALRTNRFAL